MPYHSEFFGVDVRDEITLEFTDEESQVDDMMAGLHEVRARLLESRKAARQRGEQPGVSPNGDAEIAPES